MNQEIKLDIIDISYEGKGIARKDNLVYFVDNAIDGETVIAKIYENKPKYAKAKTIKILKSSKDRTEPKCKVYEKCGGCSLRHMSYERQLQLKKDTVITNLKRMAHIDITDITVHPNPKSDHYRNKAEYQIFNDQIGFYADKTHKIVTHDECLLLPKEINDIKKSMEKHITKDITSVTIKKADDGYMVILESDKILSKALIDELKENKEIISIYQRKYDKNYLVHGKQYITDNLCNLKFQISPDSFYQVNKVQTEKLYEITKQYLKNSNPEDELKNMTILDLYCGIGTIGLFMADTAKYVIGVEIVKEAINNARSNAKLNSIVNCEFIHADVNDAILQIEYDILIADPPRKGLDDSVIQSIRDKKPETIIYISCNSSTLSRDLGMLSDLYSLKAIEAVDMFSHTGHVETVVLMSRVIC